MDTTTLAQNSTNTLKEIIDAICIDINPTIESVINEEMNTVTLVITAPENQLGQIIGKEGKIIKSLRTLLSLAYPGQRINLQIKN